MKKALLLVLLLIIILISGAFAFYFSKINKINYVEINKEEIEINEGIEEKLEGYRNIVLFGIDNAEGYQGRSDCIIIFSLNQETNEVKMTSIYRDTYLDIADHGLTKINHAYAYGQEKLAMSTINKNLDLDVQDFVTINFEIVKDVVDAVGGVEIKISSAEAKNIPNIKGEGTYILNGTQALAYGRIRKIDTDYQRTERMRTVINAVFEKTKNMSVTELNGLLDQILPEVKTNLNKTEITNTLSKLKDIKITNSIGWPYNVVGKTIGGIWYGVPKNLEDCVKRMHIEVFEDENYEPSETVKSISNKIIKKTGVK